MSGWRDRVGRLRRVDRVYFSPSPGIAAASCPGALLAGYRADSRALVVSVFTDTGIRALPPAALEDTRLRSQLARMHEAEGRYELRRNAEIEAARRCGYLPFLAGLTDAPFRHDDDRYASIQGLLWEDVEGERGAIREVAELMAAVLAACSPAEVFVPLAVGRHVNHRILFEAARLVMAVPEGGARPRGGGETPSLWFYEERPFALVDQATKMRLRELGFPVRRDPQRFFSALWEADYVKAHLKSDAERIPCAARYMESIAVPESAPAIPRSRVLGFDDLDAIWRVVSTYDPPPLGPRTLLRRIGRVEARRRRLTTPWAERQWQLTA